jgi:hypothetical protein
MYKSASKDCVTGYQPYRVSEATALSVKNETHWLALSVGESFN